MRHIFALLLILFPAVCSANDWDALSEPGAVAVMRHALAPGTGDPAAFELGDCSTQRVLNEDGRTQARKIGAAFRERGIVFDRILTSQWCRCSDTAELLDLGPVAPAPMLNSFFRDRSTAAAQTREVTGFLRDNGERAMLVTHQVNITDLTGIFPQSGEVIVIRAEGGTVEVLGRILIAP